MEILDNSDEFEDNYDGNARIVTLKYFYFENEAQLYLARLAKEGIPSFLSNTNTSTVLAFGEGGIGLNVKAADAENAMSIIQQLDTNAQLDNHEQDFSEANKEDILYQKSLHEQKSTLKSPLGIFVLTIIGLITLRAFLRAAGLVPSWWDFF